MTSFDAGTIVEELDYNFEKFGGRKGTIPEPDEATIITMYAEMDQLVKEIAAEHVELPPDTTAEDLVQALNLVTMSESYEPMLRGMTRIHAKACSHSPSEEELEQLPPRIRALFFQWFQKMMRPELEAADSTTAPRVRRIGRGGSSTT